MKKTRREIECIGRLHDLNGNVEDIMDFLLAEGLITKDDVKVIRLSADIPKATQKLMRELHQLGKFQLLEYEWTILPVERIKIVIVTDRNNKEFAYNF